MIFKALKVAKLIHKKSHTFQYGLLKFSVIYSLMKRFVVDVVPSETSIKNVPVFNEPT